MAVMHAEVRVVVLAVRERRDRVYKSHRPIVVGEAKGLLDAVSDMLPSGQAGKLFAQLGTAKLWRVGAATQRGEGRERGIGAFVFFGNGLNW